MMALVRGVIFVAMLVGTLEAAQLSTQQNKNAGGKNSNGKGYPQTQWVNVSAKHDPIVKVPIGGRLELECEAVGSPPPKLNWVHRNNLLQEARYPIQNDVDSSAIAKIRSRLIIDCVMPYHHGAYECSGTSGSKKRVSSPIHVLIEEKEDRTNAACEQNSLKAPRVIAWGPTLLELSDQDVILPCTAVGNPAPDIYWINTMQQIINSDTISTHYKVLRSGDLLINQIGWDDMGTYTCVAQSSLGSDKVESFLYPVKKPE